MRTRGIPAPTALLAAVAVLLVLAGCGIDPQAEPRDIPTEQQVDFDEVATGGEATGTSRIYLLAPADPDDPQRLRSVLRDLPSGDADSLLTSLFAGPNPDEQEAGLSTVLPREIELLDTRPTGGVLTVDVDDSLSELTPEALRIAVAQIVTTASGIDGINAVRLRVDGVDGQLWPVGDGELSDRTLTVYDYPGLIESTQPALPALPGGEA